MLGASTTIVKLPTAFRFTEARISIWFLRRRGISPNTTSLGLAGLPEIG